MRILHIGLAPRHVADVPGVADDQLEMSLKDGVIADQREPSPFLR
jgi:hypothetical protein